MRSEFLRGPPSRGRQRDSRRDRVANRVDDLGTAALGEIRNAFDELQSVFSLFMLAGLTVCSSHACMAGLPATNDSAVSNGGFPSRSVTMPPASWTISIPAATSHGARTSSQNASNLPHATFDRSSAAEPARRIPAVPRITKLNCSTYCGNFSRFLKGKPVPTSDLPGSRRLETRMRLPSRNAPPPRLAVNSSSRATLRTTPAHRTPLRAMAIATEYSG